MLSWAGLGYLYFITILRESESRPEYRGAHSEFIKVKSSTGQIIQEDWVPGFPYTKIGHRHRYYFSSYFVETVYDHPS